MSDGEIGEGVRTFITEHNVEIDKQPDFGACKVFCQLLAQNGLPNGYDQVSISYGSHRDDADPYVGVRLVNPDTRSGIAFDFELNSDKHNVIVTPDIPEEDRDKIEAVIQQKFGKPVTVIEKDFKDMLKEDPGMRFAS